ncbi:MAG: hypothetical protein NC080_07520 [Paraprevotella sp.]|nr:hypothetical protein [Paraprevotella sp.]
MSEEYYEPDPNAPVRHKLNPCHEDHIDALNWAQRLFEGMASHCRCCSGVRIATLLVACVLMSLDYPAANAIGVLLQAMVCMAIFIGAVTEAVLPEVVDDDNLEP